MGVTTWKEQQDTILIDGLKSDQTYMEIADKLGISKAMVSGRIHRLRKLRPSDLPAKNMFVPMSKLTDPNAEGELAPKKVNLKKIRKQFGTSGQAKTEKNMSQSLTGNCLLLPLKNQLILQSHL